MAPKLLLVALLLLGAAQADPLQDLLGTLQSALTKGQAQLQHLNLTASNVLASSGGPLGDIIKGFQDKVKAMVDNAWSYGKNATQCALGQRERAANITLQAGKDIFGCTQAQVQATVETHKDLTSLNNQAMQLARDSFQQALACLPRVSCLADLAKTVNSKVVMLASAAGQDLLDLAKQGISAPVNIANCGTEQVAAATIKVGDLLTQIGECIKNIAQNS